MAYADESDLEIYEPGISEFLPSSQSSFKTQRDEADRIIKRRLFKDGTITDEAQLATTVDPEIKTAAIYKSLELIFGFLKVNKEDQFAAKQEEYRVKFSQEYRDMKSSLTIDIDESGAIEEDEENRDHVARLRRS